MNRPGHWLGDLSIVASIGVMLTVGSCDPEYSGNSKISETSGYHCPKLSFTVDSGPKCQRLDIGFPGRHWSRQSRCRNAIEMLFPLFHCELIIYRSELSLCGNHSVALIPGFFHDQECGDGQRDCKAELDEEEQVPGITFRQQVAGKERPKASAYAKAD